jgi:hypothetical protein
MCDMDCLCRITPHIEHMVFKARERCNEYVASSQVHFV